MKKHSELWFKDLSEKMQKRKGKQSKVINSPTLVELKVNSPTFVELKVPKRIVINRTDHKSYANIHIRL